MPKRNPQSPFVGRWHIVSMAAWDDECLNEEVQAFIEFASNGTGHFQFCYVRGYMDWRVAKRDGKDAVEWTWEGNDEMDPATGRGWAMLKDDELHGAIFIHLGDESDFEAQRAEEKKRTKRK